MNSPRQARPKSTPSSISYTKDYKPFMPMCTDRITPADRKGPNTMGGRNSGKGSTAPAAATPAKKTGPGPCYC